MQNSKSLAYFKASMQIISFKRKVGDLMHNGYMNSRNAIHVRDLIRKNKLGPVWIGLLELISAHKHL
jgi:hypothetical protein